MQYTDGWFSGELVEWTLVKPLYGNCIVRNGPEGPRDYHNTQD
jgi:hypothetical protein